MLKAFLVGQTDWAEDRYILIFARRGVDAKILGQHHVDWDNWLKFMPKRAPEKDSLVEQKATDAYVHKISL